jgi:hypothetical protein
MNGYQEKIFVNFLFRLQPTCVQGHFTVEVRIRTRWTRAAPLQNIKPIRAYCFCSKVIFSTASEKSVRHFGI